MRFLSAVILVLSIAVLPSCKFLNEKVFGKKARALAELRAQQDSIRVADSIRKAQEYLVELENARLDSLRIAEEVSLANEVKYNIIVGSFITPQFAKSLADEYTAMGYDVRILQPANSKFELVAAEGHNSLRTAIGRLSAFQDTVHTDSWIYINR
jgi:hypothetical protein